MLSAPSSSVATCSWPATRTVTVPVGAVSTASDPFFASTVTSSVVLAPALTAAGLAFADTLVTTTAGTSTEPTSETLPSTSVARKNTVAASSSTTTGTVYSVQSPSSPRRYSIDSTPEPSSVAVIVTDRADGSSTPETSLSLIH